MNIPPRVSRSARRRGDKKGKREFEEFGPGKKDLLLCRVCSAVYYNKSWHHNLASYKHTAKRDAIALGLCPACAMWRGQRWEGEVRITNIPKPRVEELSHTILHFADDAYRRDPMPRLLDMSYGGRELRMITSENQLAQKLAKHLAQSFKHSLKKPKMKEPRGNDSITIFLNWEE